MRYMRRMNKVVKKFADEHHISFADSYKMLTSVIVDLVDAEQVLEDMEQRLEAIESKLMLEEK